MKVREADESIKPGVEPQLADVKFWKTFISPRSGRQSRTVRMVGPTSRARMPCAG